MRENGGQYTHAALWTVLASAMLGDGDRAGELFALLNPINHAPRTPTKSNATAPSRTSSRPTSIRAPHTGRGGWTKVRLGSSMVWIALD